MVIVNKTKKGVLKMTNGILEHFEDMEDFGEAEIQDYNMELLELEAENCEQCDMPDEMEFLDDYEDDEEEWEEM